MEQPIGDKIKMMHGHRDYWFPRRRYGWGWGCPHCWQGWAVLAVYALLLMGIHDLMAAQQGSLAYAVAILAPTLALIGICYAKGERPQWSWGGSEDTPKKDEPPQNQP